MQHHLDIKNILTLKLCMFPLLPQRVPVLQAKNMNDQYHRMNILGAILVRKFYTLQTACRAWNHLKLYLPCEFSSCRGGKKNSCKFALRLAWRRGYRRRWPGQVFPSALETSFQSVSRGERDTQARAPPSPAAPPSRKLRSKSLQFVFFSFFWQPCRCFTCSWLYWITNFSTTFKTLLLSKYR